MKHIKYKPGIFLILAMCAMAILSSCKKDFFEIEDPNGFEVVGSFEDEGAVQLYLNKTYALIIQPWPVLGSIHHTSDEINNASTAFLYGQLNENSITDIGTGTSINTNRYSDIRRCNVSIEGLNSSVSLSDATKKTLKGQFFFLRAYLYFRLVRLYGGVPLVLNAQNISDESLATPRANTSECIASIVRDLDSAAAYLPPKWTGNDIGKATKVAALALKGRALLYWASPQFNLTNDAARWTNAYEANKAAYEAGITNGYGLFPSYANIFVSEDHQEVLIVRKYNTSRNLGTNLENQTRPSSESQAGGGQNQPTWNLVQAYGMNNGIPTTSPSSNYNAVQFWLNRDPRFEATIAYNGASWPLSGKATRKQWSYVGVPDESASTIVTGFYNKRMVNNTLSPAQGFYDSNTGGGSGMDWLDMRFAEVILNLAESANETGNLTEAKDMVRVIRKRAGIVAGTGSNDYGLVVATDKASMRNLLINERQVEFAMEGMRYYDLRRWRRLDLITPRQSYKLTPKSPYVAGTGTDATKIYLDKPDAFGIKPRDTANLNNPVVYSAMFVSTTATLETGTISLPDKYYVYPMPTLFTQTSAIKQTNGWSGGTFDPYQ